jgi:hypothetical protein
MVMAEVKVMIVAELQDSVTVPPDPALVISDCSAISLLGQSLRARADIAGNATLAASALVSRLATSASRSGHRHTRRCSCRALAAPEGFVEDLLVIGCGWDVMVFSWVPHYRHTSDTESPALHHATDDHGTTQSRASMSGVDVWCHPSEPHAP